MCFVVTCLERADLLALVCGVFCEFLTFPLVSWVRCGTWLYRSLIFATLLTLSGNHHRVCSSTHRRAIKEESKFANREWVDHKAYSLLQYINVIANLFIMENYFNELRWKDIRANNLIQFIYQVTIELRFQKSLTHERFKSNLEFSDQIIVSSIMSIKFRKGFAKFMIPLALFKKFLS